MGGTSEDEGLRIDAFNGAREQSTDELTRTHALIQDVHERMFRFQIDQAEKMSNLAFSIAKSSVDLLEVVIQANATTLGKAVAGEKVSDTLVELLKTIKAQFAPKDPQ